MVTLIISLYTALYVQDHYKLVRLNNKNCKNNYIYIINIANMQHFMGSVELVEIYA